MDFKRQEGIFNPKKHDGRVTVVGAGGIGGPTVLALSKMGCKSISVYDDDTVEKHNQPNQLYGEGDFGHEKVDSLNAIINKLTGYKIATHAKRFDEVDGKDKVIVSAVDSMGSRREIYDLWAKSKVPWLVDGRVGNQQIRVYATNRQTSKRYEKTIRADYQVAQVPCTQAAVIDVMFAVSALVARTVRIILTGKRPEFEVIYDHKNLIFIKEAM